MSAQKQATHADLVQVIDDIFAELGVTDNEAALVEIARLKSAFPFTDAAPLAVNPETFSLGTEIDQKTGLLQPALAAVPQGKPVAGAAEAVADAWASIDGKAQLFRDGKGAHGESIAGHTHEGYMVEAEELIKRLAKRGYVVLPASAAEAGVRERIVQIISETVSGPILTGESFRKAHRTDILTAADLILAALSISPSNGEGWQEDQRTVSDWCEKTFGVASSNARVAARANEEMAELLRALTSDEDHPKAIEEAADVVIILYRLADLMGANLHAEIDRKMQINRSREWRVENGHGYHVRPGSAADARVDENRP